VSDEALRKAVERTFDKVESSAIFVPLFTKAYSRDPRALMELGMALVLDKPIYLLVQRDTKLPENLRRLACGIEYFTAEDDVDLAATRLMQQWRASQ